MELFKIYHIQLVALQLLLVVVIVEPVPRYWDVKTTQGIVRGYYKRDPPHFAFLGVPYARPPTGYDRFKTPKPPRNWDGIFEATHKVKCPQFNYMTSENCLVLNIFVPTVHQDAMSVLVHIHDGYFQSGWGSFIPPNHFNNQGIITVTFNSRLGLLGYLCLRTTRISGNAGLKDQVAAFYWLQRNIGRFNGNPNDITVYGTGSGAVSLQILILSGCCDGLFHKAIFESGSVLSPSSLTYDPIKLAFEAAHELGYEGNNDISNLEKYFVDLSHGLLANVSLEFLPCIERHSLLSLLNNDPLETMKTGKFLQVPMMFVYGDAKEMEIVLNSDRFNTAPKDFVQLLPNNLYLERDTMERIAKIIQDIYFGNSISQKEILQSYVSYINDIFMEYPVIKTAAYFSFKNIHPVFLMKFAYKTTTEKRNKSNYDDIFKYLYLSTNLSDSNHIINLLTNMWLNFIKLSDPTPITTELIPEVWSPVAVTIVDKRVNYRKINYLYLDTTLQSRELSSTQKLTFWEHIYSKYYRSH